MTRARAIAYAEDDLGVHKLWAQAQEIVSLLQNDYRTAADLESKTRDLNFQIDMRKNQILVDQNALGMTPTAQERAYKAACASDELLGALLKEVNETMSHRDQVRATILGHETNLKAHNARMNEIGGYCQYLAAVKQGSTAVLQRAMSSDYPWD